MRLKIMRKNAFFTPFLPLIILLFMTCADSNITSSGYNISNYIPLKGNVKWKYVSSTINERLNISISGTTEINGERVVILKYERVTYESGGEEIIEPVREVYFSSSSTEGVFIHGYYDDENEEEHIFTPKIVFGGSNMKVGDSVESATDHNGKQVYWTSNLVDVSNISVTYGDFTGVLHLILSADGEDSPIEGEYWLFNELGIVMWQTGEGNIYELTDYTMN